MMLPDKIQLTDFGLFQEYGLDQGDIPVSIWLTNLRCHHLRFHEAQSSIVAMKALEGVIPTFGTSTRKKFVSEYINIGEFYLPRKKYNDCGGLDDPNQQVLRWCYSISNQWPEYEPSSRRSDFDATHKNQLEMFAKQLQLPLPVGNDDFWERHETENVSAFVKVPLRSLKAHIGDVLEVDGKFWIILGWCFARLNILS